MQNIYTENLTDFGLREIGILKDTLEAWLNYGLPEGFEYDGVKPAMNRNSGHVFLVNAEYQVAMLNGNSLEIFHNLPYGGAEGFLCDLLEEYLPEHLHSDDIEYILQAVELANVQLPLLWSEQME